MRCEVQVCCFFYLHQLAYVPGHDSTNVRTVSKTMSMYGMDTSNEQQLLIKGEEDAVITGLHTHLIHVIDSAILGCPASIIATVIAPTLRLIPRLLIQCAVTVKMKSVISDRKRDPHRAIVIKETIDGLCKAAVALQQNLTLVLQRCQLTADIEHRLAGVLAMEFARCRQYIVKLLVVPSLEDVRSLITYKLKESALISNDKLNQGQVHICESYSKLELKCLWDLAVEQETRLSKGKSITYNGTTQSSRVFEDDWRQLESELSSRS